MAKLRKQNSARGGAVSFTKLAGGVKGKNKFRCGVKHTADLRNELRAKGLGLGDTSGGTQRATLLRVLTYLGPRGLNTTEAVGCGYYRIATRVHELIADGWLIDSYRENIVGADGLYHVGMARYVLRGKVAATPVVQLALGLRAP